MSIKINKPWDSLSEQEVSNTKGCVWKIADVVDKAKDLKQFKLPLKHLCIDRTIGSMSLREFVGHMRLVLDADLSHPIILDDDGSIFDGRHRVARALLEEHSSIKAVRFEETPPYSYKRNKNDK